MTQVRFIHPGSLALIFVAACSTPPPAMDEAAGRAMLNLLMPSRIEIVEPFTRIKRFDSDAMPEAIELFLQAVNSLDNPGLMIAGRVRVELFEYVPASGHPKGRRLEHWDIELTTEKQQRTYWNTVTQMYEFRLGIDPRRIPPADKYVLTVTYHSPLGDRLTDEYVIDYRAESGLRRTGRPRRR